jgi:hypothetical protein
MRPPADSPTWTTRVGLGKPTGAEQAGDLYREPARYAGRPLNEHGLAGDEPGCCLDRHPGHRGGQRDCGRWVKPLREGCDARPADHRALGQRSIGWMGVAEADQRAVGQRTDAVEAGDRGQARGELARGVVLTGRDQAVDIFHRDGPDVDQHFVVARDGIGKVLEARHTADLVQHRCLHLRGPLYRC